MKATKYLSLAALALMGTLASCQSDDEASIARPANAVGINVTVGSLQTTRSNPASADFDEAHLFNQGDQVCVSTEGQDPVIFQCQDADQQTWAEAVPGKFLLWTQSQMTFLAYYPVTPGTSMTNFTLPADQSSADKIAKADYMTREYGASNEYSNDINLTLERKTARVIVRINGFTDQYDNNEKTVSDVRINSQYSDIVDGDNGTGDVTAVTPYQQGNGGQGTSYTALVVPSDGDSGADFITLTDGESNTLTVKGIPELRDGYSYTFNLVVGKNKIEVASVTVQDWATGAELAGGQAVEQGAAARTLAEVTAEDLGKIVGADGKIYATKAAAEAVATGNAVAMIASVDGSNGLAIALADESDSNWSTAKSTCEGKSAVTNAAWLLPSKNQWNAMFGANGGNEEQYTGLNNALAAAGGDSSKLKEQGGYWSSSENTANMYWRVRLLNGVGVSWGSDYNISTYHVRACLAFTVEQGAATARPLAEATAVDLGKIVGADGKIYDTKAAAEAVATGNAVAMIAYVGSGTDHATYTHGLAIALANEAGEMNWNTAKSTCEGKSAVTNAAWLLPSLNQWKAMFSANGGNEGSFSGLDTAITNAGGTALGGGFYWTSTPTDEEDYAWTVQLVTGPACDAYEYDDPMDSNELVRACLAF